jgi:hypothetical protein
VTFVMLGRVSRRSWVRRRCDVIRSTLLISALVLTGCGQKHGAAPPKVSVARPELKMNLKEKLGQTVEVTGLLGAVSVSGTKEPDQWIGETTAALECKGMTLACKFPPAPKAPVRLLPGVEDMRLVTVRGTVVSVEPEGTATLADCVVVSDPAKP